MKHGTIFAVLLLVVPSAAFTQGGDAEEELARIKRRLEREAPAYCGELKLESQRLLCFADYAEREGGPAATTHRELMKRDPLDAARYYAENKERINLWSQALLLRMDACWEMVKEAPDEAHRKRQTQRCADATLEATRAALGR